ncbi:MAG: PAS domain-containing protein, partial [Tepidiformaceae bacterium]
MGLWAIDLQTEMVTCSRECPGVTGISHLEASSSVFMELVHPLDSPLVAAAFELAVATHRPLAVEFRYRQSNGEWRWLAIRGEAQYEADGTPKCMAGIV